MPMKSRIAPVFIVVFGTALSIFLWLGLASEEAHLHFISTFTVAAPWVALIGGTLISFLIAVTLLLIYQTRERAESLKILNENFKKEIAERIEAEESKQHLEKALLQGQKLQAIGTLAGGIAHDFNNLLYAITGYAELAREDVDKNSITYQNLGKVLDGCHRGKELISRILAFSRRHHPEFKSLPIKATIESVLALLKPTIPASVDIHFISTTDEDHMIVGNQTQLHQVIVNIINNAVDAMDDEGVITIQLSYINSTHPILRQFPKIMAKSYSKIDISDTGHGMDQSTAERIFEPFFTTKEVGKGTGLGLSTVHTIIEEHKGEILVTSKLGHGTTFTILLPET